MNDDSALAVGILLAAGAVMLAVAASVAIGTLFGRAVGATALFGLLGLMALRWAAIVAGGDGE